MRNNFKCFAVSQKIGPQQVGFADIFGVRDIGGRYCGEVEAIAVEVKLGTSNFGKLLGQALGYSLFAHKCYLAVSFSRNSDGFSIEQREMANKLGVGLMEIRPNRRTWKCKEVLSSKQHSPVQVLLLKSLDNLGYNKCSICDSIFGPTEKWTEKMKNASPKRQFWYGYQLRDENKLRKLLFTNSKFMTRYIIVCWECLKRFKR